jgi:hypothetical protein
MTESELARVEAEAGKRWPLQASLIVHRVGALKPGDNIVLVVTASAHREAAFAAAEFLMDYLKTRAPFWKQVESALGTSWVDAKQADDSLADRWARQPNGQEPQASQPTASRRVRPASRPSALAPSRMATTVFGSLLIATARIAANSVNPPQT